MLIAGRCKLVRLYDNLEIVLLCGVYTSTVRRSTARRGRTVAVDQWRWYADFLALSACVCLRLFDLMLLV